MVLQNYNITCVGAAVSLVAVNGFNYGLQHWHHANSKDMSCCQWFGHKVTAFALWTPVLGLALAIFLRAMSAILYSSCCQRTKQDPAPTTTIIHPTPNSPSDNQTVPLEIAIDEPSQLSIKTPPTVDLSSNYGRPNQTVNSYYPHIFVNEPRITPSIPEPTVPLQTQFEITTSLVKEEQPPLQFEIDSMPSLEEPESPFTLPASPKIAGNRSPVLIQLSYEARVAMAIHGMALPIRELAPSNHAVRIPPVGPRTSMLISKPEKDPRESLDRKLAADSIKQDLKSGPKETADKKAEVEKKEIEFDSKTRSASGEDKIVVLDKTMITIEGGLRVPRAAELVQQLKDRVKKLESEITKKQAANDSLNVIATMAQNIHELDKLCYRELFLLTKHISEQFLKNKDDIALPDLMVTYNRIRSDYYTQVEAIQCCQKAIENINGAAAIAETLLSPAIEYLKKPKSMQAYCNTYSPEIAWKEVETMRTEGQILLNKILRGQEVEKSHENVKRIMWALMYYLVAKGQGYEEGAFIIRNANQHLFKYLTECPGHYPRLSSHPVGNQCDGVNLLSSVFETATQHGLDIEGLPAGKTTILFDLLNKGKFKSEPAIYIKLENHGTSSFMAFFWHSIEYIKARQNKKVEGADDKPDMRKERVPAAAKKLFELIGRHCSFIGAQLSADAEVFLKTADDRGLRQSIAYIRTHQYSTYKAEGLSFMHEYLSLLESIQTYDGFKTKQFEKVENEMRELRVLLSTYDNLEFRTGREGCFKEKDLLLANG